MMMMIYIKAIGDSGYGDVSVQDMVSMKHIIYLEYNVVHPLTYTPLTRGI